LTQNQNTTDGHNQKNHEDYGQPARGDDGIASLIAIWMGIYFRNLTE
jgi:hypothetical protein